MLGILRPLAFLALVVLPGAWVAFPAAPSSARLWSKLLTSVALSPLLLSLQLYGLRLLGVSFDGATVLLAVLNLPALALLGRQRREGVRFDRWELAGAMVGLLVPLACLAPQLLSTQARVYSGHAWMHTGITYMIANGDLVLDDPALVGVRLDYYWLAHVYQAVLSYVLGSAPAASYIWTNVLFLLATYAFVAALVGCLGGGPWARLSSIAWLSFGVNFVGYALGQIVRGSAYGDPRYTPWLFYFLLFHQITLALGIFAALLYWLVRPAPEGIDGKTGFVVTLLLCSLGLIYPLLFPIGAVVVVLKAIAIRSSPSARLGDTARLTLALSCAAAVTAVQLHVITRDRVIAMVGVHTPHTIMDFAITTGIVTLPLWAALAFVFPRCWRAFREATLVLVGGGLISCLLYVVLRIDPGEVQYKFIFTAAVCLAPFPSLALEAWLPRSPRVRLLCLGLLSVILAAPFAHKLSLQWPWGYRQWGFVYPERPLIDTARFAMRLADSEDGHGVLDAIRDRTPANSLLVFDRSHLDLISLTGRRLYVPSAESKAHPGVNVETDHLLTVLRGYDRAILAQRRRTVAALLQGGPGARTALAQILSFDHPVVILLDRTRHADAYDWLQREAIGKAIYEDTQTSAWLVHPTALSH